MVISPHVSFCWSLTFLTKTSVSLKICTRGDHACCFRSTFYTHYIFICWLVDQKLLSVQSNQHVRLPPICDHLYPERHTRRFASHIPIIRTSRKRPPPKSDCDHFLALKLYFFQLFSTSCKQPLHLAHGKLADESPTLLIGNEGLLVRTGNYGTYCNSKLFGEETHCGSILLSDDSIYALWVVALL